MAKAEPQEIIDLIDKILNSNDGTYEKWLASAEKYLNLFLTGRFKNKYTGKDIVHTLIDRLCISGSKGRNWDKDKYPDFRIYFFMIIRSHVWDLAKVEEKMINANGFYDEDDDGRNANSVFDNENNLGLDDVLSEADAGELEGLCLKELNDDEEGLIFMAMAEGKTNKQIADDLGVEVRYVENTKKRIKRKLMPVFEAYMERAVDIKL